MAAAPAIAAPHASFAEALRAFGPGARLDAGITSDGATLTFPPHAAWLWVRLEAGPGSYRLAIAGASPAGPAALRVELVIDTEPVALPLEPAGDGTLAVRFALDAAVGWLRLAPVEAGAVRFTGFELAPHAPWRSLLPDWRVGPLLLPFSQAIAAPVETALAAPDGWDPRLTVVALENLSLDGATALAGPGGVLRLAIVPPLRPGTHLVSAQFRAADGAPAWVAPRLHRDGAAPNTAPAAHFRRRGGARYVARLDLAEPAAYLVFQPRQEFGSVRIEALHLRAVGPLGRALFRLGEGWRHYAPRLFGPLASLLGEDARRDGPIAAWLRLLTRADLRYRRSLRREEAARIRRWLARPVLRPETLRIAVGPGAAAARAVTHASIAACKDAAVVLAEAGEEVDLVLPAGARLLPHALAAIRRTPPGAPLVFDTDRTSLGLRSAPHFRAPSPDAPGLPDGSIPLVLAHLPRALPAVAPKPARRAAGGAVPRIAIVTATRDAPGHLSRFLATLRATWPDGAELILIDNASTDPAALDLLARAGTDPAVRVVRDDRPFNFAALSNFGAALARSDILIFANNDIEFRYPNWAQALSGALDVEGTGIAGALLEYPDRRVQHAGIALAGEARVRHIERFSPAGDLGYFGRRCGLTPVTAVTGALMAVRREDFCALGGFAAGRYPVLYNDVDLCLRARRAGLATLLACHSRAVHHESVTFGERRADDERGRGGPLWRMERAGEADRFRQDWAPFIDADPCYPAACDPVEAGFQARE